MVISLVGRGGFSGRLQEITTKNVVLSEMSGNFPAVGAASVAIARNYHLNCSFE